MSKSEGLEIDPDVLTMVFNLANAKFNDDLLRSYRMHGYIDRWGDEWQMRRQLMQLSAPRAEVLLRI